LGDFNQLQSISIGLISRKIRTYLEDINLEEGTSKLQDVGPRSKISFDLFIKKNLILKKDSREGLSAKRPATSQVPPMPHAVLA